MVDIFLIVAPVFVLIAVGYFAVRTGYVQAEIATYLNAYAIKLAVPVLLFSAMVRIDFGDAFSLRGLVSFYAGAIFCFIIGIVLSRYLFKRRPGEAVAVGFAATFSNSLLLGLPIVERAYGADALMVAFGVIALHAPTLYTIGMITMEMMRRDGKPLGQTLAKAGRSIITNPLMTGILAGILFNLSGLTMPEALAAPIKMLAGSAIPAALVGMGAALTRYRVNANLPETAMVGLMSLVVHPAIVLGLSHSVFEMPREAVLGLVTIAAMPPGINIYVFATLYGRAEALAASALLVSTALSVITISFWLYALSALI